MKAPPTAATKTTTSELEGQIDEPSGETTTAESVGLEALVVATATDEA